VKDVSRFVNAVLLYIGLIVCILLFGCALGYTLSLFQKLIHIICTKTFLHKTKLTGGRGRGDGRGRGRGDGRGRGRDGGGRGRGPPGAARGRGGGGADAPDFSSGKFFFFILYSI